MTRPDRSGRRSLVCRRAAQRPSAGGRSHQRADRSNAPARSSPVTLTISGSAYTSGPHQLEVTAGTATASRSWEGTGDWTQTIALDTEATSAEIALLPGAAADGVLIDRVQWTRPVVLAVGERGAMFQGEAGIWRDQLAGVTDDQALYRCDRPCPAGPDPARGRLFADGPEARQYLLTGSTTLHTPDVQVHRPIDLVMPSEAEAVYVAPRAFHAALEPLIGHRRQQGYTVELIAVEADCRACLQLIRQMVVMPLIWDVLNREERGSGNGGQMKE